MEVPQMFRAQVQGRCSLQYTPDHETRNQWLKEWIDPEDNGQVAKHDSKDKPTEPDKAHDIHRNIYRIKKSFGYRVFTNCGLDSIFRPPLGKNGIPFIPGSSIKGLFRRACNPTQRELYCGSPEKPGCLRFYGAFPIGDWEKKTNIPFRSSQQNFGEVSYGVMDIVHPQEARQVETQDSTSAIALISFLEPTFVFEFGSAKSDIDWSEVKKIFEQALKRGLGGKTSNGYGFQGNPNFLDNPETIHLTLKGNGVSSVLLSGKVNPPRDWNNDVPNGKGKSEFRPQLFKASLRSHLRRLLAGVSNDKTLIAERVNQLFGSSDSVGLVNIFWEKSRINYSSAGRNPTYKAQGKLHLYSSNDQDFIEKLVKFAYVMAGFGKSWRRVDHEKFFPSYHAENFAIGCHWDCQNPNFANIHNINELSQFLNDLYEDCKAFLNIQNPRSVNDWREAWHPDRLVVFSKVTQKSQAIKLFHKENFKTTPAIGGREPGDKRPTAVSCVWHRMLPVGDDKYLEIVTVFHSEYDKPTAPWQRVVKERDDKGKVKFKDGKPIIKEQSNQFKPFIEALENQELEYTWGTRPN